MKKMLSAALGIAFVLSSSNIFAEIITCPGPNNFIKGLSDESHSPLAGPNNFIKGLSNRNSSALDGYWRLAEPNTTGFRQFYIDADPNQDRFPTDKKLHVEITHDNQIVCQYEMNTHSPGITTHSIDLYNINSQDFDKTNWKKANDGTYSCNTKTGTPENCAIPILSKIDL